jgi:ribosomal protein S18 acetylase RimI-like enzyme
MWPTEAETIARSHCCLSLRLEVHESNHAAIKVYGKAGYRQFGRHARYYEDCRDALRFEKLLALRRPRPLRLAAQR